MQLTLPDHPMFWLGLVVAVWTLLPLVRHPVWWVRAFDFPRMQVVVLTALVLLGCIVSGAWQSWPERLLLGVLAGCVGFQLLRILPYTRLYPQQLRTASTPPQPEHTLSLLVANVLMPNRNAKALLSTIARCQPDVLLTLESDHWWQRQLEVLAEDYPWSVKLPLDNLYGMHLFSRLPLAATEVRFLVEEQVPSIHTRVSLRSGQSVDLHCLHPAPPSPTENPTSAERDAELVMVARDIDSGRGPVVVMGDLNDVAWSYTTRLFQRLSGLLDPRVGRGMFSTFHAGWAWLRWPLDHVFCSPDFTLVKLERLPAFGSDHFPIQVVLAHTPAAASVHEVPQPAATDDAVARHMIDQVDGSETALLQR